MCIRDRRNSTWENEEALASFPEELVEVINQTIPTSIGHDRPLMVNVGDARTEIGNVIITAIEGGDVQAACLLYTSDILLQAQRDDQDRQGDNDSRRHQARPVYIRIRYECEYRCRNRLRLVCCQYQRKDEVVP